MTLKVFNQKKNMGFSAEGNLEPRVLCVYPDKPVSPTTTACNTSIRGYSDQMHKTHVATVPLIPDTL